MILPPKRFEDPSEPKYDPIRPRKWFTKLAARRRKLPFLRLAYQKTLNGSSQKSAAEEYGVDERELRDYENWIRWNPAWTNARISIFQPILDGAYQLYCEKIALMNLNSYIRDVAPLYGVNPRHVEEEFDINPTFLPTGYQGLK